MEDNVRERLKALIKSGKGTYIMIGAGIIAALLVLMWPEKSEKATVKETIQTEAVPDVSEKISKQIADMVSAITGEAAPHVTVTLRSSGETVYATEDKRSERNSQEFSGEDINKTQTDGDTEKTYIIVKASDGSQKPLIVMQTQPEVLGVVVVSKRGGEAAIKERITQAVKTAFDLSSTQVCVTGCAEYT